MSVISYSQQFSNENINYHLELKDSIDNAKWNKIYLLTDSLKYSKDKLSKESLFELNSNLSRKYEYFKYDSAFHYGNRALKIAYELRDKSKIAESKANLSLVLLLRGLYKETIDTIQSVDALVLPPKKRIEFYAIAYRAYYDLSNSRWGYYSPKYRKLGDRYVNKIQKEGNPDSYQYLLALALKSLNNQDNKNAVKYYSKLVNDFNLDAHQTAICQSGLGVAYGRLGKTGKAKECIEKAVIGDILSATKETLAAKMLAEIVFHEGDLQRANKLIAEARKDAEFYGSDCA